MINLSRTDRKCSGFFFHLFTQSLFPPKLILRKGCDKAPRKKQDIAAPMATQDLHSKSNPSKRFQQKIKVIRKNAGEIKTQKSVFNPISVTLVSVVHCILSLFFPSP